MGGVGVEKWVGLEWESGWGWSGEVGGVGVESGWGWSGKVGGVGVGKWVGLEWRSGWGWDGDKDGHEMKTILGAFLDDVGACWPDVKATPL